MDISSIKDWTKPLVTSQSSAPPAGKAGETTAVWGKAEQDESVTQISRADIETAVGNIQEFVQSVRRNINFSLDESSDRVVVKVTDSVSGEVIRQIPSEEALKLAESLSEARSLLFTAQV
jgi:flagellar protein FlaG